jgi:[ribosomal protein S18]-alanine N-acetyltransferase
VVAYCFAPVALSSLWSRAVWGGHLLKWLWRWLRGRYGLGLHPVKVLFLNKIAFLRSSLAPTQAADARILSIAVAAAWRGRGVAGALMTAAESYFASHQVRRIRLEVRPDNEPAVRLYQHHGYIPAGTTYDSQGSWLIMFKALQEGSTPTFKSERCAKN